MNRTNNKKDKVLIWSVPFIIMVCINFLTSAGTYMTGTALPKFANFLGGDPVKVGLVSSIYSLSSLAVRPLIGSLLDFYKKKIILCISLFVSAIVYFVCAFATDVNLLVIARFIDGIGSSVKIPVCLALATEFLPSDSVGKGIGYYSLAQAIASAIGPGVSLAMINTWGYKSAILFIAFVATLAAIAAIMLNGEKYIKPEGKFKISLNSVFAKEALFPALIVMTLAMPYSTTNAYLPIMGDLYNINNIGVYHFVFALVLFVGRPICGKLLDKVEFAKVLLPTLFFYMIAMVLLSQAKTLPGFIVAAIFSALGYGMAHPVLQTLCMKWTPANKRGAAGNTYYVGVDIGFFVGTMISGELISLFMKKMPEPAAYSRVFLFELIPIVISICVAIIASKRIKTDKNA